MEYSNSIRTRFLRLYETAQWSDCSFLVDDSKIKAHRLVLATSSPVFEVMCYGPLAQNDDTIHITDMNVYEFKQLLSYIYTDTIELESIDNAWRLLYAAKKYLLTTLADQCIEFIVNNLCAASVLRSYELAEMYEEEKVQLVCLDLLKKYTNEVLTNLDDYHIASSTLNLILDQNTLNASEWDLICASICWCEDECLFRNWDTTQVNRRTILEEIGAITKLRFMSLPVELLVHPMLTKILTDLEIKMLQQMNARETIVNKYNDMVILQSERRQRFRIALPFYTATRWILKGASILRINSVNTTVKTLIRSNRRVLVSSFTIPTRLLPNVDGWLTHHLAGANNNNNQSTNTDSIEPNNNTNTYLENFTVSISNAHTKTQLIPDTVFKHTVPNSSNLQVKLVEAVVFDCGIDYQIDIRWPFDNFDLNGYEYSLDCLSQYAERKGTRFTCQSEYDFIQSISYSPYSM